MKQKMLRIFLLLVLISAVIYGLSNIKQPFFKQSMTPQVRTLAWQDVPEMTDILDPKDQEKRLLAARKLVERVDVEDALEILEHSPLPHTGEGHLVVHQIGFHAYRKYGIDSILKCKDYFLYACYHGAIIEAATDQGFEAVTKMTDKCKEYASRYFQCVHAAGHALMAMWNYELDKTLETCDQLYEKETQFPDALSSCHNGAFMENLFGVHDWGKGEELKRDWLSEDPYFPCNYFGEKYQKGCWLNQAARIYQVEEGDIPKTAQVCQQIGNSQHTLWCMDNLARQIHPLTNGDVQKSFSLCQQVGSAWYDHCVVVNAGAYYSVGGRKEAISICQNVLPNIKPQCYQLVLGQLISDPIEKGEKAKLCQTLEAPYNSQCSNLISLSN